MVNYHSYKETEDIPINKGVRKKYPILKTLFNICVDKYLDYGMQKLAQEYHFNETYMLSLIHI